MCGAIDCTHVRIQAPGGNQAEVYRNRKGWFSINVQVICDAALKIQDIVARYPGSSHDSHIFNNSLVRARFENNEFGDKYLLGDSAYPCRRYLLTPLLHPQTDAEERYNRAHISTRNIVERTFGVWKRRFSCLANGLRINVQRSLAVIVATAVLHNICLTMDDDLAAVDELEPEPVPAIPGNRGRDTAVRTDLINTIFTR